MRNPVMLPGGTVVDKEAVIGISILYEEPKQFNEGDVAMGVCFLELTSGRRLPVQFPNKQLSEEFVTAALEANDYHVRRNPDALAEAEKKVEEISQRINKHILDSYTKMVDLLTSP